AGLGGSDDRKLYATLRHDGTPAGFGPVIAAGRGTNIRTADLPQNAPQPDSREEQVAEITAPPAPQASNAPLPPARPFDLGTIPGAGVPIAPLPPRRATLAALH
ncbi:MAG: septal ring lytic transglycosylase RlpA family protein, partial [Methylobacteriaceae bacterium]|nr:septal ring lytic transglycosylase RlpA family protein [Methylobacteriaceae bacterium]